MWWRARPRRIRLSVMPGRRSWPPRSIGPRPSRTPSSAPGWDPTRCSPPARRRFPRSANTTSSSANPPPPVDAPKGPGTPPPQPPSGEQPGPPASRGPRGPGGRDKRRWPVAAGLAVLAGVVAAAIILITYSSDDGSSNESLGERVPATLGPVPTNKVDGLGDATLRLKGNMATVSLKTKGLLDGESHAMHIHAGEKGQCPTVAAARDHNGHLSISTTDGAPFYGSPRVSLTTRGDIGVVSILEFARYPTAGNITYKRTIRLRPRTVRFIRRNLATIVVHGID